MKKLLLSTLLGTALTVGATASSAQGGYQQGQGQQQGQPGQQQQTQTNFSDKELEAYAGLAQDIHDVRVDYQKQIQNAPSEEKARELQQEAQGEMVSVIEASPIDVDTFNAIGQAYGTDPELRERIIEKMEEAE